MDRAELQRPGGNKFVELAIATAKDSIIGKLESFRLSKLTSERQWNDVTRLLDLLGEQADFDYLRRAAAGVAVKDLLDRLTEER